MIRTGSITLTVLYGTETPSRSPEHITAEGLARAD